MCGCFNTLPLQWGSSIWSRQKMAYGLVTICTENKISDLQVGWKNLLPLLSLYRALYSQLAGSHLAFLLFSVMFSAWPTICQQIPVLAECQQLSLRREDKKIPGKAETTCPVSKRTVTKQSRVGQRDSKLTEMDLVCDYNYILMGEMLHLKS